MITIFPIPTPVIQEPYIIQGMVESMSIYSPESFNLPKIDGYNVLHRRNGSLRGSKRIVEGEVMIIASFVLPVSYLFRVIDSTACVPYLFPSKSVSTLSSFSMSYSSYFT